MLHLIESILYDCVYHSAPIILCVLGGMFAYKANVLNIALDVLFVAILDMATSGAAIATVVSKIFSFKLLELMFITIK